jgi:hypothetical protein
MLAWQLVWFGRKNRIEARPLSHVFDHNKKGGPSTAGASAASACSITIGLAGHTLDSTRTAMPAGSPWPRGGPTATRNTPSSVPNGKDHGRYLDRLAHGATNYCMQECGERKDYAYVSASGRCCEYNGVACAPDDPRFLALVEQVAPVEVRPAAAARHPPSPTSRPQAIVRCAGSSCTRRSSRTPLRPRCTQARARQGSFVAMPCPARRRTERWDARRCASPCACRTLRTRRALFSLCLADAKLWRAL